MKEIKFSAQETLLNRKWLFGVIWGWSLVFFETGDDSVMGIQGAWQISMAVMVLCILMIFNPQKNWIWLALGLLVPIQTLFELPMLKNHAVFFGAFGVAVAVAYLTNRFSKRRSAEWFDQNEPFFRVIFFLGYGAAAIAKLNSGFFDYRVSCANSLAMDVYDWLPFAIPFREMAFLPSLVAITELFIFIGLMFHKIRPWAVIIAALFHFALSLNATSAAIAFNPTLYSMLILFLPKEATDYFVVKWGQIKHKLGKTGTRSLSIGAIVFISALLAFFKFQPAGPFMSLPSFIPRLAYSTVMVAILIIGAWKFRNRALGAKLASVPNLMAGLTVFIIVLNAASPYLGGKTVSTFTMFSNLRVEGGVSNHFFIPRLPVKSLQDDLVAVLQTSNRELDIYRQRLEFITFTTMQHALVNSPNASVIYVRNGQTIKVPKVSDSDIMDGYDPFWGSIFGYRAMPSNGGCAW